MNYPVETLNPQEIMAVLKCCSARALTGIRNKALIVTWWRAGLRVSESLALAPADIDLTEGKIRVNHGKGGKMRVVGIDPQACDTLRLWLDKRRGLPRSRHFFCTLNGDPVSDAYCRQLCKRLAIRAGLDKRVHPHCFRHTHAFELANEGTPLHVVQKQLGHSSVATTSRYLDHVGAEVVSHMRGRDWSG